MDKNTKEEVKGFSWAVLILMALPAIGILGGVIVYFLLN